MPPTNEEHAKLGKEDVRHTHALCLCSCVAVIHIHIIINTTTIITLLSLLAPKDGGYIQHPSRVLPNPMTLDGCTLRLNWSANIYHYCYRYYYYYDVSSIFANGAASRLRLSGAKSTRSSA